MTAAVDVTVLVAAFNAEHFLLRALNSALSQKGVTLEVLVVNDGSSDRTAAVANSLADPRVRVIEMASNSGPAAARNEGLAAARGRWVAILDADDAYEDNRLLSLILTAEQYEADIIADNFRFYDALSGQFSEPALKPVPAATWIDLATYVDGARPFRDEADLGLLKPIIALAAIKQFSIVYPADVRHGEDFVMIAHALEAGAKYLIMRSTVGYAYTLRNSGVSRTRIDYGSQIRAARSQSRVNCRIDSRLSAAYHMRAEALSRLSAERQVDAAVQSKSLGLIAQSALSDRYFAAALARKVARIARARARATG